MIELYQPYIRSCYIKKLLTIRREDTFTLQPTKENYWKNPLYREETFIKKTVKEGGLSRQWSHFLQRLIKLIEDYNQLLYCTIDLKFIRRNFKIIREICERDPDKWK